MPRIQDKSIPPEIITLTPTPTATLIPNDENKNNGSAEDNVSNPKDTDSNIVSGNNDLKEKFVPVLDDLYIDNLFGFSIKYPSNWIVDSTKTVPSIAEIKLTPDNVIGDIYLLYTDGNLSNVDIVDQFISPIKQQPDFTILSETNLTLANDNQAYQIQYQWKDTNSLKNGFVQSVTDKIKNYIIIFEIDSLIYENNLPTIRLLANSFQSLEPQPYDIPRYESLVLHIDSGPVSLDPAFATGAKSIQYIQQIFSGLTGFDKDGYLQPDIADTWLISDDAQTYTFTIKDNATYHSGRKVTSIDIQYSWERALKSQNKKNVLNYLGDILGAREFSSGDIDNLEGFNIIDDSKFEIKLVSPTPYFISKLSHSHTFLVDSEQLIRYSENNRAWEAKPIGTGPFVMGDWLPGVIMYLYPYPDYHLNKPEIDSLIFRLYGGKPALMYQSGEIDATTLFSDEVIDIYNSDLIFGGSPVKEQNLIKSTEMSTYYIGFNTQSIPFDDINVRKAFAQSSNVETIVSNYFESVHQNAYGLIPPQMPDFNSNLDNNDYIYDPESALNYLSNSDYYLDKTLPDIFYNTPGYSGPNALISEIINSWIDNLGVNITTNVIPPDQYYYSIDKVSYDIYDYGWIADYPDPHNFLYSLFHSKAGSNVSKYNNPDYDSLIDLATMETNEDKRIQYYIDAEEKLINDVVLIPLYHGSTFALIKDHVSDINFTPYGMLDLRDVKISNFSTVSYR
ncbi:MAG: ABC transporter substrate-binding protein [Dehalococcoidia bacterium]|nr:ABC transporter substrate-binding protein [Dehalococcoidia bacterium]